MWMMSSVIASGAWNLMTAYSLFVSSSVAGRILKFAPIGVIKVPQNPAVIARELAMIGFAPCAKTKGIPIPTVITVNAAKAFPIIIVKIAIPTQYATTPRKAFPSGIIPPNNTDMSEPTPAAVKTAPNAPNNCGKMAREPIVLIKRVPSEVTALIGAFVTSKTVIRPIKDEMPIAIKPKREALTSGYNLGKT